MKFIYQDILRFLSDQPSKDDLSKKLFQLGHEHEIDGEIFDVEITPNRGDCLSLLGLSRDLNSFYKSLNPYDTYEEDIDELDLNFINLSVDACPKISFLEIEIDEEVIPYKPYLENLNYYHHLFRQQQLKIQQKQLYLTRSVWMMQLPRWWRLRQLVQSRFQHRPNLMAQPNNTVSKRPRLGF